MRTVGLLVNIISRTVPEEMTFGKSMTFDREGLGKAASAAYDPLVFGAGSDDYLERLRSGDPDAFDNLVTRYSGEVYAVLFRITENSEEAADLTQETFLSALRSIKGFRGESELKTWLIRIAVNHSRNRFRWWKRRKREKTISLDTPIGDGNSTVAEMIPGKASNAEEIYLRSERESALQAALRSLPEQFRIAVLLCDIEGLSYDEISQVLDLNIGTVKSRIARGREELRKRLKDF